MSKKVDGFCLTNVFLAYIILVLVVSNLLKLSKKGGRKMEEQQEVPISMKLDEIFKVQDKILEIQQKTLKKQEETIEKQDEMKKMQDEMNKKQDEMSKRQDEMSKEQEEMKKEMQDMKKEQQEMKKELVKVGNTVAKIEYEHGGKIDLILDVVTGHTEKLEIHDKRFEKDEKITEIQGHKIYGIEQIMQK